MTSYIYKSMEKKCKRRLFFFIFVNFVLLFFFLIPSVGAGDHISWNKASGSEEIYKQNFSYSSQYSSINPEYKHGQSNNWLDFLSYESK